MSPFTILILIAFALGAFGFIDEETELNFDDELSSSEDFFKQSGEWEERIVGGSVARRGQFPHQVLIYISGGFCGGSILNQRFVLTAAHCTQGSRPADLLIRVGALLIRNDGILHRIHSVHDHPEYARANRSNDISILRTETDILFDTPYVRPVRLPILNVPAAGNYTVYVSGWGLTSYPGRPAHTLQYKDALTLNREECVAQWGNFGRWVHENTVCVQNPVGRGACMGDSGGALISQSGVQVGVVSWGSGCARGQPDVYANVWSHLEWIRATIRANSD